MGNDQILVVDDAPSIVAILKLYLTGQGYDVLTAATGREALDLCRRARPSLVLLDVGLPDIDGYEVGKGIRARWTTRHIPIVFVTAHGERGDRLRGLREVQAQYYIVKPFDLDEVHAVVTNLLLEARRKNQLHPVTNLPSGELLYEQQRGLLEAEGWAMATIRIGGLEEIVRAEGRSRGEELLLGVAQAISNALADLGGDEDFVGQTLADSCFIVTSTAERLPAICQRLADRVGRSVALSIGILSSQDGPFHSLHQLSRAAAEACQRAEGAAQERAVGGGAGLAARADGQGLPPLTRSDVEAIARWGDLALLTISVVQEGAGWPAAPLSAQALLGEGALCLPPEAQRFTLGESDVALALPAADVEGAVGTLLERFYERPLDRRHQEAHLVCGWARGGYPAADELVAAVANDSLDHCASPGLLAPHRPSILLLEPERPPLEREHGRLTQLYDTLLDDLRAQRGEGERAIRAEIGRLSAVVDHDVSGGLAALSQMLGEIGRHPSSAEATEKVRRQLTRCMAWKRSIVELGTGGVLAMRSLDLGAWLRQHLGLLSEGLAPRIELRLHELSDGLHASLDPQTLLVACLNLLLAAHKAGAHGLRVASLPVQNDGGCTLVFEDDGGDPGRERGLQLGLPLAQRLALPWPYQGLELTRRIMQLQGVQLSYEQRASGFQMVWRVPGQHGGGGGGVLALGELRRETARLQWEVGLLEQHLARPAERAAGGDARRVRQLLLPFVESLEQSLQELFATAGEALIDAGVERAQTQRVLRLSLYCYLLVHNLALALRGGVPPGGSADINSEVAEVLDLLEHKLSGLRREFLPQAGLPRAAIAPVEAKQIMMNVVKNAAEAIHGSGCIRITTALRRGRVVIQVADTGHGIPPESRERIFHLNFSSKGRGDNSGVGLYTVRSIVSAVGGRVGLGSATLAEGGDLVSWESGLDDAPRWTGPGTIFQIELPVAQGRGDGTPSADSGG